MLTSALYYCFLSYLVIKTAYSQATCSCELPDSDFATGVNLVYYNSNDETPATTDFPITQPQGLLDILDTDKRVIFYIFGYNQVANDLSVQAVINALCHGNTDNVVLLDWTKYSNGSSYATTAENSKKIGSLFARSIQILVNNGLDVSKVYPVGFSLGAHIAGFVGKCNNFVLPRITGLEPANPELYLSGCYLEPSDAMYIDVIHTDMGGIGTAIPVGSAEYFANTGARPQPGCKISAPLFDFCNHLKAGEIYALSKLQPTEFSALECLSYTDYANAVCRNNLQTGVGYNASTNVYGHFYFSTGVINVP